MFGSKRQCEKLLKGSSSTFKRALKDMYFTFLEFRKHKDPNEKICKKLDDAIYRFVREYLKEYNITELVNCAHWLTRKLPRYIFSSYMPKYLEACIQQLTFGGYTDKFKNNDYNYQYGNKVSSQINKMDDFNRTIREIHYTYINFMTSENDITDDDLKTIVQNIFEIAKQTPYNTNLSFHTQYSFKYMTATGYDVPEGILLIAQKYIDKGQSYKQEDAVKDLKEYIAENKPNFIKVQDEEEKQIKEKLDKLFGPEEEISYEPYCFCFKKPVSKDKYNFGINTVNNNEVKYNILPLTNELYLDEKEFYKFYKS